MSGSLQKFEKYDHVKIAKLGGSMSHFPSDTDAVVVYSYNDKYGGGNVKDYCLYVNGSGKASWYEENQITLIDKNGKELIEKWEIESIDKKKKESDIDWIFLNGKDVIIECSSSTVEALALCLGITPGKMWGSRGEGFVYYMNAMAIIQIAKPFLEKCDKDGWINFCNKQHRGNK